MELDIISYHDLLKPDNRAAQQNLKEALLQKGMVGIKDVPEFENKTRAYINAAREFSNLPEEIKLKYTPNRDLGENEGYEIGAEQFQDENGRWQADDKKASFYAFVPDDKRNKWPAEVDFKTPYLALGELIFKTGKLLLTVIGLDESIGLAHNGLQGYGRMLHYHKVDDSTYSYPNWCGAHFDHGVFTGLTPAYYFSNGLEIDEPEEAGLYIIPTNCSQFEKVNVRDKSILLFQAGEFSQLLSNDKIQATKHVVKKAKGQIERFAFALFYSAHDDTQVKSTSTLISDARYYQHQFADGSTNYKKWQEASFERYRAK